jgi:hypothetical protein
MITNDKIDHYFKLKKGINMIYGINSSTSYYTEHYSTSAYVSIKNKIQDVYSDLDIEKVRYYGTKESIKALNAYLSSPPPPPKLYIQSADDVKRQEKPVLKILGAGGSKKALELSNGKALLIPNMDTDSINSIYSRWERIVKEEVKVSQFIQKIGLLGTRLQEVKAFSSPDTEEYAPAYTTDTFESLKARNIYVIDRKNMNSSTWAGNCTLFSSIEDTKDAENWKPLVQKLIQDCAKVAYYHLPSGGDSFNVAVVRDLEGYKIRYFGFDYSDKDEELHIPTENFLTYQSTSTLLDKTSRAFETALDLILFQEGRAHQNRSMPTRETINNMKQAFQADMLREIQTLQKPYCQVS